MKQGSVLRVALLAALGAGLARADVIVLRNGEMLEGKARQWGHKVLFWDRYGEEHVYPREEVRSVQYQRRPEELVKPNLPDLTVRYIERLPRDPGFHGGAVSYDQPGKRDLPVMMVDPSKYQLHRKPGEKVTFIVHVLNAGPADAAAFDYVVSMDDKPLSTGRIEGLKAGEEKLVSVEWAWQTDQHHIKVELDPKNTIREITRSNNTFTDPTRALTFFFAVHKTTYENFSKVLNVVDSFNFEDWAQYHVHMMNFLFAESKWPSAPDGIAERVRVDKIIIVPECDEKLYVKDQRRNGDPKEVIEYNGNWSFGKSDPVDQTQRWALSVDWGLPHELGHQLGLVDIYQLNIDPPQILVRRADGTYGELKHFYPAPETMMHWHGPHLFSEQCADYLNHTLGRPRGLFGDYYFDVPDKCILRILSLSGRPVPNARIELYQRHAFEPPHSCVGPQPIAAGETDAQGQWLMPNRPAPHHTVWAPEGMRPYVSKDNPWGQIHVVGSNAMILARVQAAGREEFYFLRLHDFNVAYARGHDKEYTHVLRSRFPDAGAPEPPAKLRCVFHMPREREAVELWWDRSPSPDVDHYNIYKKIGADADDAIDPYRMAEQVPAARFPKDRPVGHGGQKLFERFYEHGFYQPDTLYAVTAATADGRESGLSEPVFIPKLHETCKAAVLPDGRVLFSAYRANTLFYSPGNGGLRDFGLRTPDGRTFSPEGMAVDGDGHLILTDGANNQVTVFDAKGDLVRKLSKQEPRRESASKKPGEFNYPNDAATDADGNVYVLERENCRVQVFDKAGKLRSALGYKGKGEEGFERPSALAVCGQTLLVSDEGNRRVVPFRLGQEGPKFEREIAAGLVSPDRALLTPLGRVAVCDVGDNTVKVFDREGKLFRKHEALEGAFEPGHVKLDGPRGLCTRDGKTAYLVTRYPARTLKLPLE